MIDKEIQSLKMALNLSPDNIELKKILLSKMVANEEEYRMDIIDLAKDLNSQIKNTKEYIEILLSQYFKQDNLSACLVIIENLPSLDGLSEEGLILIAKVHVQNDNLDEGRTIYQDVVARNSDIQDEELDKLFRQSDTPGVQTHAYDSSAMLKKPNVNFSDVGGMNTVKREIEMKIIKPLEHLDLFKSYGKKVGGGILLYGPPGCGKTFIAKATAGEINSNFINIGLNDVLDMWIGNSEKNLHDYFELARRSTPCVIFFDEIDALGAKRSGFRGNGKNIINQFLAELDGVESDNDGILIMGASNSPWDIDSAFRRPGRFDRIIFVPPPDRESREKIFRIKLKEKPHGNIDYDVLVRNTKNYSGADIDAIIDIAIETILEEAMRTGTPKNIETADLLSASKKHNPSTIDWLSSAKNYALFANKSGLYDDVLSYLKNN